MLFQWLVPVAVILMGSTGERAQLLSQESFNSGPGKWLTGRNELEAPGWHRNVFGFYGEGIPLKWSDSEGRSGGYAYSEPP